MVGLLCYAMPTSIYRFESILLCCMLLWCGVLWCGDSLGKTYLFDLEEDPEERNNLAHVYPEIVRDLQSEVATYRAKKPKQNKYWMVLPLALQRERYASGDCSMNPLISEEDCVFKHPFMRSPDDELFFVNAIPEFTKAMALSFVLAGTKKLIRVMMFVGAVYVIGRRMFQFGGRRKGYTGGDQKGRKKNS